jgi:hypothetical protein
MRLARSCRRAPAGARKSAVFWPVRGTSVALPRPRVSNRVTIGILSFLNLFLQVFDGVATYVGWERVGEANPLLRAGFHAFGAAPTLLVAKVFAVVLILWIAHAARSSLVVPGLVLTIGIYVAFSLIPWSIRLLG